MASATASPEAWARRSLGDGRPVSERLLQRRHQAHDLVRAEVVMDFAGGITVQHHLHVVAPVLPGIEHVHLELLVRHDGLVGRLGLVGHGAAHASVISSAGTRIARRETMSPIARVPERMLQALPYLALLA